jgi:hypothetical protein
MNEGLKILAERVKTNPEEFVVPQHTEADKWWEAKRYLNDPAFPWTDEEKEVIKEIHQKIEDEHIKQVKDKFTSVVMKTLMDEDSFKPLEEEPLLKKRKVSLSSSQVGLSRKMGISPAEYAKEILKIKDEERIAKLERALKQYEKGEY